MARKRMIDPSIWTDEGMAELAPIEQVLYIGLFSIADDDGRLKASPVYLRLALPTVLGDVPKEQVQIHLENVLRHMRQLRRYSVAGVDYLHFANYAKWQRIDRPQPSQLPDPVSYESSNDQRAIVERSSNDQGAVPASLVEEKLVQDRGSKDSSAPNGAERVSKPAKYTESFEAFWSQYPTGHGVKTKAFDVWKRLSTDDRELVLPALDRWKACERWQQGYVKAAEIWLRDRIWEQPPPAPKPKVVSINGRSHSTKPDFVEIARDLRAKEHKDPWD